MSKKSQIRLVVPHGGQLNRLISIRERSNGGLNITCHVKKLLTSGPRTIKESKVSIHVSPSSEFNTIYRTDELTDGTKAESHLVTAAVCQKRYQLVHTRSVAHPGAMEALVGTAKGQVVEFPPFDPNAWTMFYQLWVTSPELGAPQGPYSMAAARFVEFCIIIPFCYVPRPTPPIITNSEMITTSEERIAEAERAAGMNPGPQRGVLAGSMAALAIWEFNKAIERGFSIGMQPLGDFPPEGVRPNFSPFPQHKD